MSEITPVRILLESDKCIRCGNCFAVCPVSLTARMNKFPGPKHIGGDIPRPTHEFEVNDDNLFLCTACCACRDVCPGNISIEEITRVVRSKIVESGRFAKTLKDALESTVKYGNPWGLPRSERAKWTKGLTVKDLSKGEKADVLLFVGCTNAYDTRSQEVTKSMAKILNKAKVDFGILGTDESCCGEPVRWIGETGLFEELKQRNTELFEKHGVSKIVTMSPHCYDTLNYYYDLKKTKVQHYTEFLYELVHTGRVKPSKKVNMRITFHDPCTLGRKHKVFDEPREILKSIPGVDLIEMERVRDEGFCCGGGAGRVWLETPVKERLSVARLHEASKTKPDVVATSCPWCLTQLEDAVKTIGDEHVKIKDVAEIFAESIE